MRGDRTVRVPIVAVGLVAVLVTGALFGPGPDAERGLPATLVTGPVAPRPAPARAFGWPLRPVPAVSRPFQPPSRPYGPGHRGADLVGTSGQPVLAAGDGTVVHAGPLAGRGVVSVEHRGGLRTTYEPVRTSVTPGRTVRRGEPLGVLDGGHPGCPATACLHWGLRRDGGYLDPLVLVRPGRVRLLPWSRDP